jgi:uncharacterized Zn finger protein
MFTKNALRQFAGSTVFGRGEDYYRRCAVKKLKQRGNSPLNALREELRNAGLVRK